MNHELAIPEGLVRVAPGADSDVYCDINRTVVWKLYNPDVTVSTIIKYQELIRQAQHIIRKLPRASFRYNNHSYTIRVDAITPILSVGVDPATYRTVATSPYVPGPNVDTLQSIFRYNGDSSYLYELPAVEQERLQVFCPDSQPLFDQLSLYNGIINNKLRKSIPGYPGYVISMNEKIRMPGPSVLSLTITDPCAEVTWLNNINLFQSISLL